jgi:hypothetical protein
MGAYQLNGRIPIPELLRRPDLLEPLHRASIA